MNTGIRMHLISVASRRGSCTYTQLNDLFHLGLDFGLDRDRARIGAILGDIAVYEAEHDRPILSALVLHAGDSQQGDGFYKICEQLGLGSAQKLRREEFGAIQMGLCHDFWSDQENFEKYAVIPD
jgi:hypothetical protein